MLINNLKDNNYMSENNKYYTPSIEEFHVGFECEVSYSNSSNPNNFNKVKIIYNILGNYDIGQIGVDSLYEMLEEGYGEVRVKYLDKEDIESLGFEYTGSCGDYIEFRIKSELITPKLLYNLKTFILNIENYHEPIGCVDTLFKGVIKNKSELKVLLKQLNIA